MDRDNKSTKSLEKKSYLRLDSGSQAAMETIASFAKLVSGKIEVKLYRGQIIFQSVADVKNNLYSDELSSMENIGTFDHKNAQGFLNVLGIHAKTISITVKGHKKKNV